MDNFFSILPFLVPLLVLYTLYKQYKDKKAGIVQEKRKVSKLNKYGWFRYIKLVFGTRVMYRQSTAIWFVPLGFSFVFGTVTLYINLTHLIYPTLPLEEMTRENGKDKQFAFDSFAGEVDILPKLNQSVKVWYAKSMSSAYTVDNIIYEITKDGKTIREYPYDYEQRLEMDKSWWNFTKYCLYISLFSLLMIWIGNRKELPVHRLGRIKVNKRRKELDNVK
jgi:hypothetical protein